MARAPLDVLYLITTTGVGGAELQVYALASTFAARGWQVGIVSMMPMHPYFRSLGDRGIRLASLEMRKGVADPRAPLRLARLLRSWRPCVVHAHMVHANLLARTTRLIAPTPRLISTMHNQDEGPQWRYYAYRLSDRLSEVTTTVSQLAVEEAVRRHAVPRSKIRLVPNGIRSADYVRDFGLRERTRAALGLGEDFTWLAVGRLTEAKRHSDLLAALGIVGQADARARLLIAGTGPLRETLEAELARTGLESHATLLGERGDVRALMQAADGFVLSSAWEGLPMVMLEASASALPIVATDVGGSRDVVEDGVTGVLTPPRAPDRLAKAMLQVMTLSPGERQAMGERAQQRVVERFDMELVADTWESLYRPD